VADSWPSKSNTFHSNASERVFDTPRRELQSALDYSIDRYPNVSVGGQPPGPPRHEHGVKCNGADAGRAQGPPVGGVPSVAPLRDTPPIGITSASSIPRDFPPVVYLPCAEEVVDPADARVDMRETRDGRTALLAYSALDRLRQCCGDSQPWLLMPTAGLAKLQAAQPYQLLLLDVEIPIEKRRRKT
jgi:hypothetical protein